jgi:CO/xanthine dehydrogenase FAD-binding subunit
MAVAATEAPEVLAPGSVDEAVSAFGDGEGVTVLAGGTIFMVELVHGRLAPQRVLMLAHAGLSGVRIEGDRTTIGAMTPVAELESAAEPLATAARGVADREIRAQATVGGNLCAPPGAESPRGDLQAALIALAARVRSAGADGERTEAVEDFLTGGPEGRLVLEVEFEDPAAGAHASLRRPHAHAYTTLAVCAARTADGVRVAVSGGGPRGVRCPSVGQSFDDEGDPRAAAERILDDVTPHDDALASAWYRRRMLPLLAQRALNDLG